MAKLQPANTNQQGELPAGVYFQTVSQSPMAICISDPDARILYINDAFSKLTGYDLEDIKGKKANILSAGQTPTCIYGELWSKLRNQQIWNGRLVNKSKKGHIYLADITITPVVDEEGKTTHYLAMHRDITKMHRLNQELDNQRTLTDTIVKSSPVATLLVDSFNQVLFQNPAVEMICQGLGCDVERLLFVLSRRLGMDFQDCADFYDLEVRYDIPGIGTPRWLSCSGATLKLWQSQDGFNQDMGQDCLLLTINDITDLKIQQDEVRINALMARLAENELVHSMREALNGAIFQLQGPVNITGAAAAIRKQNNETELPIHKAMDEVLESCQNAIDTLRRAIPDQPKKRRMPLNLNELLREVLSLYTERMLADGVVVDWKPCNTLPSVVGDDVSLCNLFKQLLDNALNAMAHAKVSSRELLICTDRLDGEVQISISDNGPGIDESIKHKVFEPFFSTYKQGQNRGGIGLVLVQDVANEHGATIDISRSISGGCKFSLTFPALSDR